MRILITWFAAMLLLLGASAAQAYWISGAVYCDVNDNGVFDAGIDIPLDGIIINLEHVDNGFQTSVVSGGDGPGAYFADLESLFGSAARGDWVISVDGTSLNPDAVVALPIGGVHSVTLDSPNGGKQPGVDFLIDDPACQPVEEGLCWMTGGGVKFEPTLSMQMGQSGPKDSFGGNVYPSCSQFPGNGGQWNHVSHLYRLHFMGTDIEVLRCGNVPGIEPGSESPETGFNFIEFQGTGWIQGIKGNKVERTPVIFEGRVEDRNEPGNEQSATSGEDIDRYFLRVTDGGGGDVFVISTDGTATGDPITITGGNLQLHDTSCD